ncbi:Thiol:disulfide interchange protein DsbC [hydrothermal vent metagenome]|uniref:Thiol:disulfide interchange protein DsbC n=1 Tax=hydrothermal vent metagenome TaxID=652676 RepID=A0A3B0Z939_9ZZZZ
MTSPVTVVADQAADEVVIRKALGSIPVEAIAPTPVAGIYEVVAGPHVIYVSADGRYMFQGELVDMVTRKSLTEPRRRKTTLAALQTVNEKDMIIYEPEKTKHTITVFTDIDCGYCRKLHNEMDDFLAAGIRVRYMMFPRAGKGSNSYNKAVAVLCSDNRNKALTEAKNGKPIDMKTCGSPVDQHMALVEQLGARGTPFIVFENGQTQPGYVPAKQMAKMLDQVSAP